MMLSHIFYGISVLLFSLPFLFLLKSTVNFRIILLYVYLTILLVLGGILDQVSSSSLFETLRITGGHIAFTMFFLTAVFFVMTERNIGVAVNIAKIVIIVSLFDALIFSFSVVLYSSQDTDSIALLLNTFSSSFAKQIIGGLLTLVAMLIFLFISEIAKRRIRRPAVFSILIVFLFIALFGLDGFLYSLVSGRSIVEGIRSKVFLAVTFAPIVIIFLILNRDEIRRYHLERLSLQDLTRQSKANLLSLLNEKSDKLQASEAKYQFLYEKMIDGVIIRAADGAVLDANPAAAQILGRTQDELLRMRSVGEMGRVFDSDGKIISEESYPPMLAIATGRPVWDIVLSIRNPVKDDYIWVINNSIPQFRKGENRPYQVYSLFMDITERKHIEDELRKNMDRYEKAQRTGQVGNWEYNLVTAEFWGSEEAKRLYGLNDETDVFSTEEVEMCIPERERVHQALVDLINHDTPYNLIFEIRPKKGPPSRTIHSIAHVVRSDAGEALSVSGVVHDVTDHKEAQDAIYRYRDELSRLNAHLQEAIEQERIAISREIHDDLGQKLTAMGMDLNWISKHLDSDPGDIFAKIRDMQTIVSDGVVSVQNLSSRLRPSILDDLGLSSALSWASAQFQNRCGIISHIETSPEDIRVSQELSTTIYRVVQESLTNIARHSDAKNAWIKLNLRAKESVELTIEDDGRGISDEHLKQPNSFGILGMRERVKSHNGEFSIQRRGDGGTFVSVRIPVGQSPTSPGIVSY